MILGFTNRHSLLGLIAAAGFLTVLSGCANSSLGEALEQSMAPDPQLQKNPAILGARPQTPPPPPQTTVTLPENFPAEIPRYPNATLAAVNSSDTLSSNATQQTLWQTKDLPSAVAEFYQQQFARNNWEVVPPSSAADAQTLIARRGELEVTIQIQPDNLLENPVASPSPTPSLSETEPSETLTEFAIAYNFNAPTLSSNPSTEPTVAGQPTESPSLTQPSASPTPTTVTPSPSSSTPPESSNNQSQVPVELRKYLEDLTKLEIFAGAVSGGTLSDPNQAINRATYARWLVAANNKIYAHRPARQIRLAVSTSEPAFQDVPRSHPDFAVIQGLAEAGIIPSSLSGDSTVVQFRPDAPLKREDLILWKLPLDTRQGLPTASVDAVQQTWGFQDAAKIDPKALRAVLADFQNGDLANIRRVFGYTTLFQPKKDVTRAEAAATLWYFGAQGDGLSAEDVLKSKQ